MMASNWSRKLHRMKWTILLWVLQYIPVPKMHHTTTTTLLLYCSQFFDPFITRTIGQWFHCSNAEILHLCLHTYIHVHVCTVPIMCLCVSTLHMCMYMYVIYKYKLRYGSLIYGQKWFFCCRWLYTTLHTYCMWFDSYGSLMWAKMNFLPYVSRQFCMITSVCLLGSCQFCFVCRTVSFVLSLQFTVYLFDWCCSYNV